MIHFTCDCCQRAIDPEEETRYVVRLEVYAAVEGEGELSDEERDHLEEIDELLERMDELDRGEFSDDVYKQLRFDLCGECRATFLKNPLGRMALSKIGFSDN